MSRAGRRGFTGVYLMSINTLSQPQVGQQPQQFYGQQPFPQLAYGQQPQQFHGQQPLGQMPYGEQSVSPQSNGHQQSVTQQPYGLQHPVAQLVSDVVLRVTSAALAAVLEQVRIDPLAQQSLCAQGQLSPQAYSNVLAESARRCAPIVAGVFAQVAGQIGFGGQASSPMGMQHMYGQFAQQPIAAHACAQQAMGQQPGFAMRQIPSPLGW